MILVDYSKKNYPTTRTDELINQHNLQTVNKEVDKTVQRTMIDLEQTLEKMKLDKSSWKKFLSKVVDMK